MRLYIAEDLKALFESGAEGCAELQRKLDMVKSNEDLTLEEKDKNIDLINFALNGGVHFSREDVLEDIKAGAADTSDMGGFWS